MARKNNFQIGRKGCLKDQNVGINKAYEPCPDWIRVKCQNPCESQLQYEKELEKLKRMKKAREGQKFQDSLQGITKKMSDLADQKSEQVEFTCIECGEIYYARRLFDMYVCPKCGSVQDDYEEGTE